MAESKLFFLPSKRFLESPRVQDLISWMDTDLQELYLYLTSLYRWISVDEADEDYLTDIEKFLGFETLKFSYSELFRTKAVKNFWKLLKYLGGKKALEIVMSTYGMPVEIKYKWTNDFVTYIERDVEDIIYGQGQAKYLSSYVLIRFLLAQEFVFPNSNPVNLLGDLDDYQDFSVRHEHITLIDRVTDPDKGEVFKVTPGKTGLKLLVDKTPTPLDGTGSYDHTISLKPSVPVRVNANYSYSDASVGWGVEKYRTSPINTISDSLDWTQASWTKSNVTVTQEGTFRGMPWNRIQSDTTGPGYVTQSWFSGIYTSFWVSAASFYLKKGNTDTTKITVSTANSGGGPWTPKANYIHINWVTKAVIIDPPGSSQNYLYDVVWYADDVVLIHVTIRGAGFNYIRFEFRPSESELAGDYVYATSLIGNRYGEFLGNPYQGRSVDLENTPVINAELVAPPAKVSFKAKINPRFARVMGNGTSYSAILFKWDWGTYSFICYINYASAQSPYLSYRVNKVTASVMSTVRDWADSVTAEADPVNYWNIDKPVIIYGSLDLTTGTIYGSKFGVIQEDQIEEVTQWSTSPLLPTGALLKGIVIGEWAESIIESLVMVEGLLETPITDEATLDQALVGKKIQIQYPIVEVGDAYPCPADEWTDVAITKFIAHYPFEAFWFELTREDGQPFDGTEEIYVTDLSSIKTGDIILMAAEVYNALSADLDRFRMAHQVFQYESRLTLEFSAYLTGWYEINEGYQAWLDGDALDVVYRADSALLADDGITADVDVETSLGTMNKVWFGEQSHYQAESIDMYYFDVAFTAGNTGANFAGKYFSFGVPVFGVMYFWYNTGASEDPAPDPLWIGIEVAINSGDTVAQVLVKTQDAGTANLIFNDYYFMYAFGEILTFVNQLDAAPPVPNPGGSRAFAGNTVTSLISLITYYSDAAGGHWVDDPILEKTGTVTVDINTKTYRLEITLEPTDDYAFVKELAIKKPDGGIFMYLNFPEIQKINNTIYLDVILHFGD